MRTSLLPAEVALHRQEEAAPYRIGVSQGAAEHALGILSPGFDILDHGDEWRITDLETGEESSDVDAAVGNGHIRVLHDYPVTALRSVLQDTLRNLVWSALIARLVVSGVRNPTDWRFDADHEEIRLHDPEGRLRAQVRYANWWFVASRDRALRLADLVLAETGLEPLGVEDLLERHTEP